MRKYSVLLLSIYLMITSSCTMAMSVPTNFVLVTDDTISGVTRINTTTNTVEAFIPTLAPAFGIAVAPGAMFAYASIGTLDAVVRIDLATNMVDLTIPVGLTPNIVAINPAGTQVWVLNAGSSDISVIDIASNTVVRTITLPGNSEPGGIVFTPDGINVYISARLNLAVYELNVATGNVIATIPISPDPVGLTITPDGKTVYVATFMFGGHTVIPISTATNTAGAPIDVGGEPDQLAISADGKTLYVTNTTSNPGNVQTVDTATNTAGTTIPVGITQPSQPVGIALTFDGTTLYVALNMDDFSVVPIDVATGAVGAEIFIGGAINGPRLIAAPPFPPQAQNPTAMVTSDNLLDVAICGITIQWLPVGSSQVTSYQIFQNGILIGTVQATDPLTFTTFVSVCGSFCVLTNQSFSISSVTSNGATAQVPVVIL